MDLIIRLQDPDLVLREIHRKALDECEFMLDAAAFGLCFVLGFLRADSGAFSFSVMLYCGIVICVGWMGGGGVR